MKLSDIILNENFSEREEVKKVIEILRQEHGEKAVLSVYHNSTAKGKTIKIAFKFSETYGDRLRDRAATGGDRDDFLLKIQKAGMKGWEFKKDREFYHHAYGDMSGSSVVKLFKASFDLSEEEREEIVRVREKINDFGLKHKYTKKMKAKSVQVTLVFQGQVSTQGARGGKTQEEWTLHIRSLLKRAGEIRNLAVRELVNEFGGLGWRGYPIYNYDLMRRDGKKWEQLEWTGVYKDFTGAKE